MTMMKQNTNRLTNSVRILYFIVPAIIVTVILAIGFSISGDIADDAAHRMARQYSIEAASNFQVHMNPHMRLMEQMSYSIDIARWLANEHDANAKADAFEAMMSNALTLPDAYFMFTVYETLQGYDFSTDLTLSEFVSWGRLSGGAVSQWFFDTRDAELPFILNIQRTRPDEYGNWDLYIWSNHRIYYQGRFVGVFTIGSPFASIYAATFGGFDDEGKRGYVIDRYGEVRLDSAGILETTADGLPSSPPVPEAADNPDLEYGIYRHLQMISGGMFPLGISTIDAIRLESGEFRYASISAIIGTDWSVMVLSTYELGLDQRYMPLIFVAIAMFVLYAVFGNILISVFQKRERQAMIELNRIEVAEESNRAKSRFLARMSHEIRTPITAVLGISEIQLRSSSLSRYMEESFVKIHDSAQTLLSIVNDILDFSKIESGKLPITNEEYQVASLINDVSQLHMVYLDHKNITFSMKIDEELPAKLVGDALRIRQVMNNLMSNSFKYTEDGSVSLSLGCEKLQNGNVDLIISIEDTGLGMTAEQLESLKTGEYLRFHEQGERFISGTGLGVPIVYSLVKMMNGQINFKSEVGKGTTVFVRIPQEMHGTEVLGKEIVKIFENFETTSWSATKKSQFVPEPMPYGKVLVVDDIDANLFVARGLLNFYDLSVETCTSGQAAIDKISQGNIYDIVFMDHLMPNLNGVETMRILRDMGYKHPIVVLTANALLGQEEEFIEFGFDGFVSKPIQSSRLNEVLIKFIRNKQSQEVLTKAMDDFLSSESMMETLRATFAKNHSNAFRNIDEALGAGDFKTAHRLAHTIKGLAGMIGEDLLAKAAEDLEALLGESKIPTRIHLSALKDALNHVLERIGTPKIQESAEPPVRKSKEQAFALLDKLEILLAERNLKSLELLDELKTIPETALLIKQIENFDFELAIKNIKTLKVFWE